MSAEAINPAYTGRMPAVCSRCGDTYAQRPCLPEMDGLATHGVCPACAPAELERVLSEVVFTCAPRGAQHERTTP